MCVCACVWIFRFMFSLCHPCILRVIRSEVFIHHLSCVFHIAVIPVKRTWTTLGSIWWKTKIFFSRSKERVCFQPWGARCSSSEHPSVDLRHTVIMAISPSAAVVRYHCLLFKDLSSLSSGLSPIMPPSCHCMCRYLHRPSTHPSPGIATNGHSAARTLAQSMVSASLISSAIGNVG